MAKYDESPGFSAPVPGIGDFDAHGGAMTAPGSDGADGSSPYQDGGTLIGTAGVSRPYDSVSTGVPTVDQHTGSTNNALDPMLDKVSGTVQTSAAWSAGTPHVAGPHHPNAGR